MSTMMGNTRRVILFGAAGAVMAVFAARVARADVTSDKPGAVLIFPKIVVDTNGVFGPPTDTEIQLTNTSNSVVSVRCFSVDATSHCTNGRSSRSRCVGGPTAGVLCTSTPDCGTGGTCQPNSQCTAEGEAIGGEIQHCIEGGTCVADTCSANDFRMTLTKRQPIAWKASEGLNPFPCDGITTFCHDNQSNKGSDGPSSIPGVQENPFFGEMKCVQVDPNTFEPTGGLNPANGGRGDLKAEVTIVSKGTGGSVDARKYNAIALLSTGVIDDNPETQEQLVFGGPNAEYNGGPNILILDHFFDDAVVRTHKGAISDSTVTTDLTVVPLTEDLSNPDITTIKPITLQFLVFNEFEQRFSTSTNFSCWRELQLSDIDTRVGPFGNTQSIFNVGVEGTLSGQTRIRSVVGTETANTVLGLGEEFWTSSAGPGGRFTDATNIHFAGTRDLSDTITLHSDQ